MTGGVQTLLHNIGDGRFAGARQPREPYDGRSLIFNEARSDLPINNGCQWMLVRRRNPKAIIPAPTV